MSGWLGPSLVSFCFRLASGMEEEDEEAAMDGGFGGGAAVFRRHEVDAERFSVRLRVFER